MPALDYSPKPPVSRRLLRRVAILLLLIAATITAIRLTPRTLEKFRFLNAQKQWLNYHAPPDQVVILEDWHPDFLFGLIENEVEGSTDLNLARVEWRNDGVNATATVAGRPLPGLDAFLTSAAQVPTARRNLFGTPLQPTPILYCSQRDCPAGKRLIRISYYAQAFASHEFQGMIFSADIFEPAGPFNPLRKEASTLCYVGRHSMQPYQTLRLFAGQSDPKDPSCFTVQYQLGKSGGMIEGTLANDGKSVSMRVLTGPLDSDKKPSSIFDF